MTRLDELLRMRDFIDEEIRKERRAVNAGSSYRGLIEAVADLYEIEPDALLSPNRRDVLTTRARQGLCWLLRQRGLSLTQVGKVVTRDHSTVLHSCQAVEADPGRRALLAQLDLQFRAAS